MPSAGVSEFELIARLAARLKSALPPGTIGIGDDCAAIPHAGSVQLLTCDSAVAGRHFLPGRTPWPDVGWKLASANVSDVCACGGRPTHALVSLGVPPELDPTALEGLYDGLGAAGADFGFSVLGGNVTGAGELVVDLFMLGEAPRFIARRGARPGHRIAVSGTLGEAAAGLARFLAGAAPDADALVRRHLRPRARLDLVPLMQRVASACIDISDGLSSELHHLARASGVSLSIEGAALPLSAALRAHAQGAGQDARALALSSGEEYELLFTLPPEQAAGLPMDTVTVIGTVGEGCGVLLDGEPLAAQGWDHLRR